MGIEPRRCGVASVHRGKSKVLLLRAASRSMRHTAVLISRCRGTTEGGNAGRASPRATERNFQMVSSLRVR